MNSEKEHSVQGTIKLLLFFLVSIITCFVFLSVAHLYNELSLFKKVLFMLGINIFVYLLFIALFKGIQLIRKVKPQKIRHFRRGLIMLIVVTFVVISIQTFYFHFFGNLIDRPVSLYMAIFGMFIAIGLLFDLSIEI